MKRKDLSILIAGALTYTAVLLNSRHSTVRASDERRVSGTASDDVSNGAAVTGKVTFTGQAPKNHAINMAADPVCSKSHPGAAMSEEVVTGPENVVANVLVYVSEGLPGRTFEATKQPAIIQQKGCQYHPHVVAVEAGQKLLVENGDPTTHNIHPVPSNNREWNQSQTQGAAPLETSFGREEIAIPVKCNIHPWMKGYIAVFKHPFFAVTGSDGKFVLKGLPPGNYTITAWHEQLGTTTQKVTIAANETKNLNFSFGAQSNH